MPPLLSISEKEAAGVVSREGTVPRQAGERLAGSYVNFYIANGGIVMPLLDPRTDRAAASKLKRLFPGATAFSPKAGEPPHFKAFATDPKRGLFILAFLVIVIGGSLALYAWRAPKVGLGGRFALVDIGEQREPARRERVTQARDRGREIVLAGQRDERCGHRLRCVGSGSHNRLHRVSEKGKQRRKGKTRQGSRAARAAIAHREASCFRAETTG